MFKCAGSKDEAFSSLYETKGLHVLHKSRMRIMVLPIINHDEAGLAFDPPSLGVLGPQVNKLRATVCLWSSTREYANAIRLVRPLKCPKYQNIYMPLFTQRECRSKHVLSDGIRMDTTLFDPAEDFEEWSILLTCANYDYGVANRNPVISAVQELTTRDGNEETIALEPLGKSIAETTAYQISADLHNATLALTNTLIPQIFHIPLSICLSSTADTQYFSSLLSIFTPPTCPPELPNLATLLYAEPGCKGSVEYIPTASSYPHYKPLFTRNVTPQQVKGWSLGFLCHGKEPLTYKYSEMETKMELVIEGKGPGDAVVKVVQVESEPGAAKIGNEGLMQAVDHESDLKTSESEDGGKGQEDTAQKVLQPREASAP
ncbi:42b4b17d-886a-4a8f-b597-0db9496f190f-CDS [Sclerotinia trifoliorum]|uniref:42b4b17d-886a-4a8f-b597-0db9496f190f-CDS n=1 Tax=Sclerotinia trifoliorum TaxID=28548 RepID=A0A8H2VVC2_9HELO|nr:42b4b17d-886a-4a8f-b597-0db9496f190f-CDS [Sclerotinia trifoliorum]